MDNSRDLYELNRQVEEDKRRIQVLEAKNKMLLEEYSRIKKKNNKLSQQYIKRKKEAKKAINAKKSLQKSFSWKVTKPCRFIKQIILRALHVKLIKKTFKSIKKEGLSYTYKIVRNKLRSEKCIWEEVKPCLYNAVELGEQKQRTFNKQILFSIVVPLYNTETKFLNEMIDSVIGQTYGNWELCMADGSDEEHREVGQICLDYAKKDARIKYKKIDKNLGISGNTNVCLEMATGDYIGLFDHDDILHPSALYEVMEVICEKDADFIYTDENTFHDSPVDAFNPHFKPDYAPDTLRANNYICHFSVFKRSLLKTAGMFRSECDGSQDYDMVLRLTEQAKNIVHIPHILYYWRAHKNSVAESVGAKPYVIEAAHKAISDHLDRIGLEGEVIDTVVPSMYRIRYKVENNPLVSIIIPNKDSQELLFICLESIFEKTTYDNFEIIIVENNSETDEIFDYYKKVQTEWDKVKVVTWGDYFNYSAINNFGAEHSNGEYLILLNNDVEIITPDWIQEMLMFAQREDVGAVGAKLYYPDDTIQHAGVGLGIYGLAGHFHKRFRRQHPGYMGRLIYAQNLSAVTAACMMVRRNVWDEVNGLDETIAVAFNDVDLCMRIRKKNYLIVWTPFAELYHYESISRGDDDIPEKKKRFRSEVEFCQNRWKRELEDGDPYYNINLPLNRENFSTKKYINL